MSPRQSARSVLMVSPLSFEYDYQTAESNKFMVEPPIDPSIVTNLALQEFSTAVCKLREADIDVTVYEGDPEEYKPSAVFPNNWISTWPDGKIITYPMATESRRVERDPRIIEQLAQNYSITQIDDISDAESRGKHLESTGAIVFDHINKIAYGCISDRCDKDLFTQHVEDLGYKAVAFHGYDHNGDPIYHTNVMLAIQSTTVVVCLDAITDPSERKLVHKLLSKNRQIVEINFDQLISFCGNVLEVESRHGEKHLVMSQTAYGSFEDVQLEVLALDKKILPIDVPTIELASGGSIRCMLAEIFLPPLTVESSSVLL